MTQTTRRTARPSFIGPDRAFVATKVPEIGVLFWVIKLITTGVGEAGSDFLGGVSIPLAALVGVGGTALAFRAQLRADQYKPARYWLAVLMVAVFGTMLADGLKDGLGISYGTATAVFAVAVAAVFAAWHRREGTISIHTITTPARERLYWSAVLATFALGTAAGDWTAMSLHLGFFGSALLFAGAICVPAIAWRQFGLNPVAAFWAGYVITRPLGASIADGLAKPAAMTGAGMGDAAVTLLGLGAFAALVHRLHATHTAARDTTASSR